MKKLVLATLVLTVGTGCSVNEVITAEHTRLDVATLDVSENLLLDVGVLYLDPGVPDKNNPEKSGVYPEIRDAESRYLPYHIKTTLQTTGYWGAVRVIPAEDVYTDVFVGGEIERSDGEFITLTMFARDITGRDWFERTYAMQTGVRSYSEGRDRSMDPYQKVFNDFANDLREYAKTLTPREITQIRQVSELRFFADMAPTAFGEHLTTDDDGQAVQRESAQHAELASESGEPAVVLAVRPGDEHRAAQAAAGA